MTQTGEVIHRRTVQKFDVVFDEEEDRDEFVEWCKSVQSLRPEFPDVHVPFFVIAPLDSRFRALAETEQTCPEEAQQAVEKIVEEWKFQRNKEKAT